jgi:hypothetical protein
MRKVCNLLDELFQGLVRVPDKGFKILLGEDERLILYITQSCIVPYNY